MKLENLRKAEGFVVPRTLKDIIYGILLALTLFLICRGLVYGQLRLLEQKNSAVPYSHFVWAGPDVSLSIQKSAYLNIKGHSPHPQTLTLSCADFSNTRNYRIKSGFFEIDYSLEGCNSDSINIKSDYSFAPAASMKSKDVRVLSYQIGLVSIDNRDIALADFVKSAQGVYQLEKQFNRITADEILSSTWDSMWYWRIATHNYAYDGNSRIQQNVNWPFLYPYLSKYFSLLFNIPVREGMLRINAIGLFFTLFGLFYLGRQLNLGFWAASIPPAWVALNPFVFFMVGSFSEPLFMMLFTVTIMSIIKRKWLLSSTLVALLSATRYIGAAAALLLCAYWLVWADRSVPSSRKWAGLMGLIAVSSCGILADMTIKWHITGNFLAGFLVRQAWIMPINSLLNSMKDIFRVNQIYQGEYLSILIIIFILLFIIALGFISQIKENNYSNAFVTASGIFMVLLTWLINPDPHGLGRYSLPLAPSIAGLLSAPHLRERYLPIILLLIAIGAGFIGVISTRLYFGYLPY